MKNWSSLFLIIFFIHSNCEALKCYICKTRERNDCFDLDDSYVNAKECTGNLKWNQKFACLMNSSMQNNLIETDRSCIILERSFDPCEGQISQSKFGTCKFCFEDECNKESYNRTEKLNSNRFIFILYGIFLNVFKYL
ncbi:hypothetical protein PVAND_012480 [Polypedilum vanderplanki]|uniref:Protein sleepless n=1 Tax=Polypedilum vanderplanki TaxID=319348 RepID=A0A9J6CML4_POLVA|nr:hypothetical protein PVAND_012480 [Polypedilum vanderplanki]